METVRDSSSGEKARPGHDVVHSYVYGAARLDISLTVIWILLSSVPVVGAEMDTRGTAW